MKISDYKTTAYEGIRSAANKVKQTTQAQYSKISESMPKEKMGAILKFVKKIANTPVELVKKHPKVTIAVGIFTTLVGGITANIPAVAIGVTLLSAGALAQSSNRHAEMKAAFHGAQTAPEAMPE